MRETSDLPVDIAVLIGEQLEEFVVAMDLFAPKHMHSQNQCMGSTE